MRPKLGFLMLALSTVLAGWGALAPAASAQDSDSSAAADAVAKRKVRTKVVPEYPATAKQMSLSGKVRIEATIAPDGHLASTRVVGGSPLLVNAALEALKKWRFEPAPKDTTEMIEFAFGSGS